MSSSVMMSSRNEITKKNSELINDIINYKTIFSNNRKSDKSIILLKKEEFDIFYSCKNKYPILVKETITSQTGKPGLNENVIKRNEIKDPFREDPEIPEKYRHTLQDYEKLMGYGVSLGHNAPAGQHKTNMKLFSETFLLSNITPQEMVLNSGLWALMENWCKNLQSHKSLLNITVFTGSVPSKKNIVINGVNMNIPQKMFKIVCCYHINKPNVTFLDIFIVNNEPYYINNKFISFDLKPFILKNINYKWFESLSGINLNELLSFYNLNNNNKNVIKSLSNILSFEIKLYSSLNILMKKSYWYGLIIYAPSLKELENVWLDCQNLKNEFENLSFHEDIYKHVKAKFIDENYKKHQNIFNAKLYFNLSYFKKANNINNKYSKHSKYIKHNMYIKNKSINKYKTKKVK